LETIINGVKGSTKELYLRWLCLCQRIDIEYIYTLSTV